MVLTIIIAEYINADMIPGITPAINKEPIGTLAVTPSSIIKILGGISEPNVPEAAITPVASPLS